jgi:hypothetical protein
MGEEGKVGGPAQGGDEISGARGVIPLPPGKKKTGLVARESDSLGVSTRDLRKEEQG